MPDPQKNIMTGLKFGLIFTLLTGCTSVSAPCFADVMHFVNGKVVRGKLDRVTGDIIEFKEDDHFGSKMNIHRIQLTNRHDVVETRGDKRYFGEIVYFDAFKLDLRTATGMVKLNRFKITNVVIGAPAEQPVSNTDVMPLAPKTAMPTGTSANKPMVHFPSGDEPLPGTDSGMGGEWEDQDAIPAVNR